jgi:hypothetical protein
MGALGPEQIGPPKAATYRPRKVLVVITEDWFALSHFVPLLTEVAALAGEVVVATRPSGRLHEIASLGVRTRAFDMQRGVLQISALRHVRDGLASIIDDERPDVVHAISMQAMVMTSLALSKAGIGRRPSSCTLPALGISAPRARRWRTCCGRLHLPRCGAAPPPAMPGSSPRTTMTCRGWSRIVSPCHGGPPWCPAPASIPPVFPSSTAAQCNSARRFVACCLRAQSPGRRSPAGAGAGVALDLALYGSADPHTRQAVPIGTLQSWGKEPGITWHGRTEDVVGVWRAADIAVTPTLGGEGMPRAMLEAGACARPLIVTDVAGCRQFVRHGVEGFVVAPGDPEALAREMARLAGDQQLRARMGAAARQRVLQDYSELAVRTKFREIYRDACGPARPPSTVSGRGAARPLRLGMKVSTKA